MSLIFRQNVSLKGFASYNIGGPARFFCEVGSVKELKDAIRTARAKNLHVFILGDGTNLLINDEGFDGLVLRPRFVSLSASGNAVEVGAGVLMPELLEFTASRGLGGLEWAGGLPGTLGGAIRGNAGAFGGEVKDNVFSTESFDTETLEIRRRTSRECRFAYRSSVFKEQKGKEIVISAVLALTAGDPDAIRRAMREKIAYRVEKHPLEYPNIGSIFKNVPAEAMSIEPQKLGASGSAEIVRGGKAYRVPVKLDPFPVIPTAYLISEAGLKGTRYGGAMISTKHPNFIVNVEDAKASDVRHLIELIKGRVGDAFGVELEQEVESL